MSGQITTPLKRAGLGTRRIAAPVRSRLSGSRCGLFADCTDTDCCYDPNRHAGGRQHADWVSS